MSEKFKKYSNLNLHYSIWMTTKEGDNAISDERLNS
jgi:hypothetical protein